VGLELPAYATPLAAGLDLRAAVDAPLTLRPMQRALVPTGLSFAIPEGFEAQIRPRSGLALKHGITCLNSPGTIDADYRGEVKILLVNLGGEDFSIARGDRIAQMVVARHSVAKLTVCETLPGTQRAHGGFGHTGI
jgi:dUTP pyrophosphatase